MKTTIGSIIKTSIITAFTIAAAFIWKDVITGFIEIIFPPRQALLYKFIAAVLATTFVILAIYIILKTESEVENVIKEITKNNKRKKRRKYK